MCCYISEGTGAKVVVEKAPYAGGDGRYSEGGLRFTYDGPEEIYELRGG